jgi:hypothetical protein
MSLDSAATQRKLLSPADSGRADIVIGTEADAAATAVPRTAADAVAARLRTAAQAASGRHH